MKALSLPVSSPIRAEKFTPPQPLVRFLSGNVVSRSRARTRASPIFGMKINAAGLVNEATPEEPSSPKVTCMGHVRATAHSALSPGRTSRNRLHWRWLKKPLFCFKFPYRFGRYRTFRGILFRWVLCSTSRSSYGRKVDVAREDSFVDESNPDSDKKGDSEAKVQENNIVPRNALSLTRCRSVPRRSPYFGGRIWESTSESCERGELTNENEQQKFQKFRNSTSEINREPGTNTQIVFEDLNGIFGVAAVHPLPLTRCKSGPARTA